MWENYIYDAAANFNDTNLMKNAMTKRISYHSYASTVTRQDTNNIFSSVSFVLAGVFSALFQKIHFQSSLIVTTIEKREGESKQADAF